MKTRITRKLTYAAALAAGLTLMTNFAGRTSASEGPVAVRPEVTADWYTDQYGYPNNSNLGGYGTGYGSYNGSPLPGGFGNTAPYGDYSQPLNGGYGVPGYGTPDCPTGNCPPNYNGSYNWGSSYPTTPNNYDYQIRIPDSRPTGADWLNGRNRGDSWDRFPNDRNRDPGFPGAGYPNSGYPSSTFPSSSFPNNTFPGNTFPNGSYPGSSYPTWPNGAYPTQPDNRWQPLPQPQLVDDLNKIETKITARYQNPDMLGFLTKTSLNQTMDLYLEASRLIDTRHVNPASYEVRTQRALEGLNAALNNPAFLRAAGANPDPRQVQALQQELAQLARTNPPRTSNEAIGLMQYASELANRRLGVRREAVALEFFNGTLDSLDTYSAFVPSKQVYGSSAMLAEDVTAALEENIVGVGVELKKHDLGAQVLGTVENGPAARARIARGDLIVGIDGRSVAGMSLDQIANMISGPAGSTVTFRLNRNGQEYTASMRREKVYVSSVAGARMLDRETGYLRLKQFSESSAEDLEKAMWSMYQTGMKSLVLDLRGNPGGLLTESIQVSNLFVPNGRIVATKGRTAADNSDERASWEKTWRIPLVVLVDHDSASASEIFAAAIQENQRGVIVGRQTYGKGTVQTHFPLKTVSGNVKLTTAKFYSPSGREMAGTGVRPDVPVNVTTDPLLIEDLSRDPDVQAAMQVISRGIASELAARSGQSSPNQPLPPLKN